ncbi:1-(5-phosphoribosyl)-5-[(5-phosphoribosylamino)methylideneamino]imidazole-4-carboxamide isomerase [Blochmannia endosymbiont of Camponotus (Colobopsis) obliquus]|uniref:1-(5-phosphoribosyl)-5-[(5- phosphoribosylamino)methylideneamino]imidazole-4- carboxamide isomerase n=1 Tax=Blochmannia endosymbiont of Camponotus (Colobopsis) obliquus TaxID=1505597 RepID=UPI00061A52FA|nr:1-(5-phosphoribosyl)-5-[(5-phosphoribosylamino)methylideneamino]imidazole-4-carboxamide isomerase [Blochmannia endosymbiont of Camponotus (Colobopsis) obliquus]AKC60619.1 1-(5-phosphoribosyl)-5-[(5-phosphoribosylamino)methylideneamino] imidazole-4-carboxamide isomerase [Blochmannia endosymbiont of Camponotus (Colobopsis) obliquus]
MIIPALDIINGNVVRLNQGRYEMQYNYGNQSPLLWIQKYLNQGANTIHLIDLSGARNPHKCQTSLLIKILKYNKLIKIQIGGGIRTLTDIETLLNAGANKIIIGSMAITHPHIVKEWFKHFSANILILALDIRINSEKKYIISINGWQKNSNFELKDIIELYNTVGVKYVLCTDISRDGTLSGSNVTLYQDLCSTWPNISFQASGGISNLEDIKKIKNSGVKDVIIGRAFLEKKITISKAIQCWQNA